MEEKMGLNGVDGPMKTLLPWIRTNTLQFQILMILKNCKNDYGVTALTYSQIWELVCEMRGKRLRGGHIAGALRSLLRYGRIRKTKMIVPMPIPLRGDAVFKEVKGYSITKRGLEKMYKLMDRVLMRETTAMPQINFVIRHHPPQPLPSIHKHVVEKAGGYRKAWKMARTPDGELRPEWLDFCAQARREWFESHPKHIATYASLGGDASPYMDIAGRHEIVVGSPAT